MQRERQGLQAQLERESQVLRELQVLLAHRGPQELRVLQALPGQLERLVSTDPQGLQGPQVRLGLLGLPDHLGRRV